MFNLLHLTRLPKAILLEQLRLIAPNRTVRLMDAATDVRIIGVLDHPPLRHLVIRLAAPRKRRYVLICQKSSDDDRGRKSTQIIVNELKSINWSHLQTDLYVGDTPEAITRVKAASESRAQRSQRLHAGVPQAPTPRPGHP